MLIDGTSTDSAYQERVKRLVSSLNGPNIKADIYSVQGGGIVAGVSFAVSGGADFTAAVEEARALGFNQILVDLPRSGGSVSATAPVVSTPAYVAAAPKKVVSVTVDGKVVATATL